jgi:hypothetical protein
MSVSASERQSPLQGLAADKARQIADDPHRVAHQQALERRHAVNDSQTEVADQSDRRDRVREQAVEAIGHGGEEQRVETAPSLITGQQGVVTDV